MNNLMMLQYCFSDLFHKAFLSYSQMCCFNFANYFSSNICYTKLKVNFSFTLELFFFYHVLTINLTGLARYQTEMIIFVCCHENVRFSVSMVSHPLTTPAMLKVDLFNLQKVC